MAAAISASSSTQPMGTPGMKNLAGRFTSAVITAALFTLSAVSCSNSGDSDKGQREITFYDIAEFTSQTSAGSVFALWHPNSTEPVIFTTSQPVIDTSLVNPGESLFIAYVPSCGDAYTSGPITLVNYGTVNNSRLQAGKPESLEGWDAEPVGLESIWGAGNKICVRLYLTYDSNPRIFSLVMNENTVDDEYPTAHLYHRRHTTDANFNRRYYAAFDVSSLWAKKGCKGLAVKVANSRNPESDTFVIKNPFHK